MSAPLNLPPFLHNHIVAIAQKEDLFDYVIDYDAGSKTGDGFMADILAVSIKGSTKSRSGETIPKDVALICKLMPQNKARQEIFSGAFVFTREVHFYKNIVPILEKVQQHHHLTPETGFFSYPHCYAAMANEETNEYVIIMKDLRESGFTLWNKFEPITHDKVQMLMVQLGRLHGLSFVLREQFPEKFAQIRELKDIMMPLITSPTLKTMMESSFDKAIELLDKAEHREIMVRVKESWVEMLGESVDASLAEPFAVMGHGDCWNNNMMFKDKKICVLDWQICRYVSPALDLVYFFFSSTNKQLRDQHFDRLIQTYMDSLTEIRRRCKCPPKDDITIEQLHDQLRKFCKYGVLMAPVLLQVIVADPKNMVSLDEVSESVEKDGAITQDFAKFDDESSAKFRQRLGDVLDDAKRWGWI